MFLPPEYKGKKKKEAGAGRAEDDMELQRVTKMRTDGPPLKWKLNA